MKFESIFLMILFCALSSLAQVQTDSSNEKKGIEYHYPSKLDTLIDNFKALQKDKSFFEGYRIQLIATPNRNAVLKFKSEFYKYFPDKRPAIVYQQPNFKLREGAYRSKLDAYKVMLQIKEHFPDAFIVRDEIPLKEL